jgi:hypothetical protein
MAAWWTVDGGWMVDGRWSMVDGRWIVVDKLVWIRVE